MVKLILATTVPLSLDIFCKGLLKELSKDYEVIALSSPGELLDSVASREGVRTIAVPMARHISVIKDFKALLSLIKVFKAEKPDMIHSMTPKAGLLCMVASMLSKVPVRVHTFTGLVFPTTKGFKKRVLKLTDRITCACATNVIPEGEGVMQDLIKNKNGNMKEENNKNEKNKFDTIDININNHNTKKGNEIKSIINDKNNNKCNIIKFSNKDENKNKKKRKSFPFCCLTVLGDASDGE